MEMHLSRLFIILFISLCYVLPFQSLAQRELNVCDSTYYELNIDTTIVAGKRDLYVYSNSILTPLYNFTTLDTADYIRDFDIIRPDLWFTIVGRSTIGFPTNLYKSIDRGQTWTLDTNHFSASNAQLVNADFLRSINNLQHLNGDTLIMFMHYYESGLIYSTDAGATWTKWFHNLITHYQGMFECGNKYYLYSFPGDGFRAWMFGFEKNLLFTPDTGGQWSSFSPMIYHPPCSVSNDTINCIYPPPFLSRCGVYNYFKNFIDSSCVLLNMNEIVDERIEIFPNPVQDVFTLISNEAIKQIEIFKTTGELIFNRTDLKTQQLQINLSDHAKGIYFVVIRTSKQIITKKIAKK